MRRGWFLRCIRCECDMRRDRVKDCADLWVVGSVLSSRRRSSRRMARSGTWLGGYATRRRSWYVILYKHSDSARQSPLRYASVPACIELRPLLVHSITVI